MEDNDRIALSIGIIGARLCYATFSYYSIANINRLVELIVLNIGLEAGVIGGKVFAILVLM